MQKVKLIYGYEGGHNMGTGKKMGRPKLDEPKIKPVQVRFSETEFEKLKECAANHNMTITQLVRKAAVEITEPKS